MHERSVYGEMQRRAEISARADRLKLVAQAEVPAAQLMADPTWKIYQQQIAGAIESMRRNEAAAVAKLTSPRLVNHEAIMDAKIALSEIRATIHAFEVALSLPTQIVKDAQAAQEILDELEARHA